jgi:hypothetical protein
MNSREKCFFFAVIVIRAFCRKHLVNLVLLLVILFIPSTLSEGFSLARGTVTTIGIGYLESGGNDNSNVLANAPSATFFFVCLCTRSWFRF